FVQLVREQPPEHCILKIDSFFKLQVAIFNSGKHYISSTEFKAGGYNWWSWLPITLCTLIDKLDSSTFVDASLRFFIHDQIRDNYLTFLDVAEKRFNATKTLWGVPNVIPLSSFTDVSKGFLVNDSCTLGAGVLVRDGQVKRSNVSLLESKYERRHTWKIRNFSDLNNDPLYSPVFSFGEWSWYVLHNLKLLLYPRGNNSGRGKDLSLYLELDNANELTHGSNLYTQFSLCIKNQNRIGADCKKSAYFWFHSKEKDWGFSSFISISDLYNTSKGFLVLDTLIVEVEIKVMLLLKDIDRTLKKTW
ncbi:Ubiquitin carboxyl-terminal hydrolase 12, partial [Bienertia sinuspersici]